MSLDGIKTEHHLTPRGWVTGAQAVFGPMKDPLSRRPADALATFQELIRQDSPATPEVIVWTELWRQDGVTEVALEEVMQRFGHRRSAHS